MKEQNKATRESRSERLAYVVGEVGGDLAWMLRCIPKVVKQELTALRTRKRTKR